MHPTRPVLALGLLATCTLFLGCKGGETLYPVSGKVTIGGTALTGGAINFLPDESKGNKSKAAPTGQIGADGTYTVSTGGRPGAPLGWYKVTIFTNIPGKESSVKIDPRYADPTRTDLRIEVVASPPAGKYDLGR